MAKDPAFLFYSKDWLQGTAKLMPEEKGIYIDLLCHQHQDGGIPNDTKRLARMVGLSEPEFTTVWLVLRSKFDLASDNRLVNRKLSGITTERSDKGWKNTIIGTLASIIKHSGLPYEITSEVRKEFRVDDFLPIGKDSLRSSLVDWFDKRLKSIGNGNANANEYNMVRGTLTFEMVKIFQNRYPNYPVELKTDYVACLEIAHKMAKIKRWTKESVTNGKLPDVLKEWEAIVEFSVKDEWFSTRSISDFNKEFQRLIQKMTNGNKHQRSVGEKPVTQTLTPGSRGKL